MIAIKHNNADITEMLFPYMDLFQINNNHEHLAYLAIEHNQVHLFSSIITSMIQTDNPPFDILLTALAVPKGVSKLINKKNYSMVLQIQCAYCL